MRIIRSWKWPIRCQLRRLCDAISSASDRPTLEFHIGSIYLALIGVAVAFGYALKLFIAPTVTFSCTLPLSQLMSFFVVTALVLSLDIHRDIGRELKASELFFLSVFVVFFVASLLFGIAAIGASNLLLSFSLNMALNYLSLEALVSKRAVARARQVGSK